MLDDSAPFGTAQQHAYSYIREQILSGSYTAGMRLDPVKIAESLAISRMPVREALRQLEGEGLVVMRPNRATTVTSLTPSEVEELFEMRAVLEALAVRFVVSELTDDTISELEMLKGKMDRVRHDPRLWVQRHDDFHQFIVGIGKRFLLAQEIKRVRASVHPYLLMYISVYNETEMKGYEHDELVAAMLSRDASAAEACMLDHIRSAATGVIDFLKSRTAG